ncbi:MAG: DUF350 domain-containing protein [Planctomycetes bacterium]|nr:DUF350 domain-containing protein [Planctomycetota bacterium]
MLTTLALALVTWTCLLLIDQALPGRMGHAGAANPAGRLIAAARTLGLFLITAGAVGNASTGEHLGQDIANVAMSAGVAFVLFQLIVQAGLRLLASGRVTTALQNGNLAIATLVTGHIVATGILGGALCGSRTLGELGLSVTFVAIAQVSLHLLVWLFRRLTAYDDVDQALRGNIAAGVAHAGLQIALALLIARAADGPFVDWGTALGEYGLALAEGLLVYPLRQFLVPVLLLRQRPALFGGALDKAIGDDRDVGVGAMEAVTYVGAALLLRTLG